MTPQHLRQLADRTGLDGIAEALREAADEIDRLSAGKPADVTDERQAFEKWLGIRPCGAAHDLAWSAWKARAILALRPERVPMTDLPEGDVTYFDGRGDAVDGYTAERVCEILRSHGITAQAKKETP